METSKRVLTIPNILSLCRIALIPVITWLYLNDYSLYAVYVLILSGVTDVVDGYIARHYDMISDMGKILDPVADKLTQAIVLFCLTTKFQLMLLLLGLLVIKEVSLGILGLWAVNKTKVVKGANWHGKVTTALLYFTMIVHIIWIEIPMTVSDLLTGACIAFMMLSFVLYLMRHIQQLHGND